MIRLGLRVMLTDRERLEVVLPSPSAPVPDVTALSRSCRRSLICTAVPWIMPRVTECVSQADGVSVLQPSLITALPESAPA